MAATGLLETLEIATPTAIEPLDDEALYEIVDGRRIAIPMSYHSGLVATELGIELGAHIRQQNPRPGHLAVEVIFQIPLTKDSTRQRRPDIAFVSSERWPIERPQSLKQDAWDVVPDLVVEVISPTDRAADLLDKVYEYFQAGVRLAWLIYPNRRCIHIFEAWNRIRVVTETDTLDGDVVLPGFRLPLNRLFESVGPADAGA
jgi:Uma2 family endonuclease